VKKTGRPWYRKGNDAWYVWHAGKQVLLAKGRGAKADAFAKFADLLNAPADPQPMARISVAELVSRYEAAARVKQETLTSYRAVLKPFVEAFGDRWVGVGCRDRMGRAAEVVADHPPVRADGGRVGVPVGRAGEADPGQPA
jgi:hypothetical protein